jgi:deoxyadenosine/deoxycytidine kinase
MPQKISIAIAGNIGVGKSTLTRLIADHFNWTPFYEAVDDNPYLADFYDNMRHWSFHSQIFFLSRRLRLLRHIVNHPQSVVQDRTIYEDAEIFARNLYERGNMVPRDYQVYRGLYEEYIQFLPAPNLIIYLKASVPTLLGRIQRRGRDFEQEVSPLYLQQLNELYNIWFDDFTLCPTLVIPADELDFVRSNQDFMAIAQHIEAKLREPANAHH